MMQSNLFPGFTNRCWTLCVAGPAIALFLASPSAGCDRRDNVGGPEPRAMNKAHAKESAARPAGESGGASPTAMTMSEVPAKRGSAERIEPARAAAEQPPQAEPPIATGPLKAVERVDLTRYMGRWYEIARYPNYFQEGVVGVVANYELTEDGEIRVTNTGREGALDGDETVATAKGWAVEGSGGAKWQVQFIWPFKADYWIIDVCRDYSYAVVGQPSRERLWILSRSPTMDEGTYNAICRRLRLSGYDPSKLERTPQRVSH